MVILKPITPAAADSFRAVRLRALQDTPSAFGSTYAKESQFSAADWERRAVEWNSERSAAYLAWDGAEACGIAAAFLDRDDSRTAMLLSMWVAPTHRRRAVGQLLVNELLAWARSRGATAMRLYVTSHNAPAIRFYDRLGFTPTGRTEPYPNDPALVQLEMARLLDADETMPG